MPGSLHELLGRPLRSQTDLLQPSQESVGLVCFSTALTLRSTRPQTAPSVQRMPSVHPRTHARTGQARQAKVLASTQELKPLAESAWCVCAMLLGC
jgi:hypothetical protein